MTKKIDFSAFQTAAASLGVDPCFIAAVAANESNRSGFLRDGSIVVRFEKHVFKRELKKLGVDPTKADVLTGTKMSTVERAMQINHVAALRSTSWGMFQIMGFNHGSAGYKTVDEFVQAQISGEQAQLDSFVAFVRANGLVGVMQKHDYATFARRYNGPNYAENKYDTKLATAVAQCKRGQL